MIIDEKYEYQLKGNANRRLLNNASAAMGLPQYEEKQMTV